jgi:hypothetical protein
LKTQIVATCDFSLTPKIERVKTESFFDSFLSFSGWCGVRGSNDITYVAERQQGGCARVYSKALVEENRKTKSKAR